MTAAGNNTATSIKSVDDLITAIDTGVSFKYLYFWGHRGNGVGSHCLSQWYPCEFYDNGLTFQTAEHYMMHRKALLFSDHAVASRVIQAKDPEKAKSLGREIANVDEAVWQANRFDIIVAGIVLK